MILIIGGAYQGKLEYARNHYLLAEEDIFCCEGTEIDFTRRCIYGIEEYVYACIQSGVDPILQFEKNRSRLKDTILICQDIFCGVVPMERPLRLWRDNTGKLCQYLSGEVDQVIRIFCGLEQRLK